MAESEVSLDKLREELKKITTIGDLDRHMADAGGIALDDDTFQVYVDEYDRRAWPLPQ